MPMCISNGETAECLRQKIFIFLMCFVDFREENRQEG